MRLLLTTNAGEVLDSLSISAADYRLEVRLSPHSYLAVLNPGTAALDADNTPQED